MAVVQGKIYLTTLLHKRQLRRNADFYRPPTKLRNVNIFSRVYLSVGHSVHSRDPHVTITPITHDAFDFIVQALPVPAPVPVLPPSQTSDMEPHPTYAHPAWYLFVSEYECAQFPSAFQNNMPKTVYKRHGKMT